MPMMRWWAVTVTAFLTAMVSGCLQADDVRLQPAASVPVASWAILEGRPDAHVQAFSLPAGWTQGEDGPAPLHSLQVTPMLPSAAMVGVEQFAVLAFCVQDDQAALVGDLLVGRAQVHRDQLLTGRDHATRAVSGGASPLPLSGSCIDGTLWLVVGFDGAPTTFPLSVVPEEDEPSGELVRPTAAPASGHMRFDAFLERSGSPGVPVATEMEAVHIGKIQVTTTETAEAQPVASARTVHIESRFEATDGWGFMEGVYWGDTGRIDYTLALDVFGTQVERDGRASDNHIRSSAGPVFFVSAAGDGGSHLWVRIEATNLNEAHRLQVTSFAMDVTPQELLGVPAVPVVAVSEPPDAILERSAAVPVAIG